MKSLEDTITEWENKEFGHYKCDCVPATKEQIKKLADNIRNENKYFDDYQNKTHQFFVSDGEKYKVKNDNKKLLVARLALGICGESGEIAEKVKKYLRGDYPLKDLKKKISKEAGDKLWYLSEFLSIFNIKLSDVAQQNLDKLADRRKRGVIIGDGDDR